MLSSAEIFFRRPLAETDPEIAGALLEERSRQIEQVELIAPKNYMSRACREVFTSLIPFTSVEGYPGKRYHAGIANIDRIERLAMDRACRMFGAAHANVQPHSGTQANQAVYFSLLEPGDTVLSMDLSSGGHLSHGLRSNMSGRWFRTVSYGTDATGFIDYEQLADQAHMHRPRLIIVGGSAYPRTIDFAAVASIAKEVDAMTLADISHFSGLVVAGCCPSPFPHIDIVTTTTNKNLRGPRGGLIVCRDEQVGRRIDSSVFPGIQGGPLPEMITAKAVCFGEALDPSFRDYAERVLAAARAMAEALAAAGFGIVTGGTDTPLVLVDLRGTGLTGDVAQAFLERHGITTNRNLVPGDTEKPNVTSGIRIGSSAIAARGMGAEEGRELGQLIGTVLRRASQEGVAGDGDPAVIERVKQFAAEFPIDG
ncbi:serine hydroxymethyltransferase [Cereibacter sphaeroides]|uniref:serine hydroxymethyltransferase n=1 Tax=Cereibacter sphaeroides TaxID=1063 RepID=UPI001F26EA7B|nr:serine hydroxymethyltransferase [Cereibacter sphaeroides]MCE6958342.1 serine hydroxymethyltransferase [Cereibacter sphaeroides]MCE6972209.1 serine hydroxymethyltransferase [Cereibacter sphaeroides]